MRKPKDRSERKSMSPDQDVINAHLGYLRAKQKLMDLIKTRYPVGTCLIARSHTGSEEIKVTGYDRLVPGKVVVTGKLGGFDAFKENPNLEIVQS